MSKLTLTFDNGPEPEVTPRVLDILARRGLKTTFFVVGQKLLDPERMELAIRAREEGHRIGNHTFTHTTPLGQMEDPLAAVDELERTDALVAKTGETEKLFRPFGGGGKLGPHLLNPQVVEFLHRKAYSCVLWNAIPRDWADPEGWVERALGQIASQDHTLMVLHDLPTGAMEHLDAFLDRAEASGAEFHNDFPQECVPMALGKDMVSLDPYVAAV
ncbi:polysaccharide deacetylase family protein [Nisaea denitrificans]|uniref:polysaccharide deacetylase family protein n=1 Tax=Nisaea denitrificans TaxID=390877 RepID=UPI00041D3B2A|nr:polysaccharide deacetylase family protein [Nisaea denitrificans]